MEIILNGKLTEIADGAKCGEILKENEIAIADGYQLQEDELIRSGESLITVKKGEMVAEKDLRQMLTARHSAGVAEKLATAKVAVCGLGGLGSNAAIMLARSGVGELLLIDFDVVEPTNLNRQAYFIKDLGKYKVDAIAEQIAEINPYCKVIKKCVKLDGKNAAAELKGYEIAIEALDRAESKATLINALMFGSKHYIIAASGMAGYGSGNAIRTERIGKRLYVCGDGESEARRGNGLMAARVNICASAQANMVIRLILGETEA